MSCRADIVDRNVDCIQHRACDARGLDAGDDGRHFVRIQDLPATVRRFQGVEHQKRVRVLDGHTFRFD